MLRDCARPGIIIYSSSTDDDMAVRDGLVFHVRALVRLLVSLVMLLSTQLGVLGDVFPKVQHLLQPFLLGLSVFGSSMLPVGFFDAAHLIMGRGVDSDEVVSNGAGGGA